MSKETEKLGLGDQEGLFRELRIGNRSSFEGDDRPVENVNWVDAQYFFTCLNNVLPEVFAVLPSEAQWEYACRAGTTSSFFFGDDIIIDQVNYSGSSSLYAGEENVSCREETVEVKTLPCNQWGLYQMHGNVCEWCRDWCDDYPNEAVIDPVCEEFYPDAVFALRGGAWMFPARGCRSAQRYAHEPAIRYDWLGFRIALCRTSRAGEKVYRAQQVIKHDILGY
ncbi:MAG: formylglycine-generating enzyme family protein [Candidatus Electrothrix sp. ATG2]|nr:formylglycine-generating enzyme family protein [Candidatus Electrothrix sp. ATG2]